MTSKHGQKLLILSKSVCLIAASSNISCPEPVFDDSNWSNDCKIFYKISLEHVDTNLEHNLITRALDKSDINSRRA